jgi:hypothetical protein
MYKTTFIPIIAICVHDMVSFNVQSFLIHVLQLHIYMAWLPLYPFSSSLRSPCCPSLLPFVLPFTYLAPSSCDRNRPPSSQVACKLTLFAPPFTQLFHPFQLPSTPIDYAYQRRHWDHSALTMRNTPLPWLPLDTEEFHRVLTSIFLTQQIFHTALPHHFHHSSHRSVAV